MRASGPISSSLAAIGSVLAATSCCLPVGTMWLAATAAGAGAILESIRPWLTALSVGLIAFGFWQSRRAQSCSAVRRRTNIALLTVAAFFVGASVLLPAILTIGGHAVPAGQPELVTLQSIDQIRSRWNASPDAAAILVLLSPT